MVIRDMQEAGAPPSSGVKESVIRWGDYTATITERGAALRELRFRVRDLIVPFAADAPSPDYRGIIAAPWPNRIADGKYTLNGVVYQVPVNETERACALHGLVFDTSWTLESVDESSLALSCFIRPTEGYPFTLRLLTRYRVDGDGLHASITATNIGEETAPYGVCPHPYLLAGPAPLDEWTLEFPAEEFLEVTEDRLLPTRSRTVSGHEFDFRTARPIGTTKIDHAFTGIRFDAKGRTKLVAHDPSGSGVGMQWDRNCPWLQIHTADKQAPLPNRLGLAVEPMTCPPNAFNSGRDLVWLQPESSHEASWRIFAI
jgi:aldose 1-epimerase